MCGADEDKPGAPRSAILGGGSGFLLEEQGRGGKKPGRNFLNVSSYIMCIRVRIIKVPHSLLGLD